MKNYLFVLCLLSAGMASAAEHYPTRVLLSKMPETDHFLTALAFQQSEEDLFLGMSYCLAANQLPKEPTIPEIEKYVIANCHFPTEVSKGNGLSESSLVTYFPAKARLIVAGAAFAIQEASVPVEGLPQTIWTPMGAVTMMQINLKDLSIIQSMQASVASRADDETINVQSQRFTLVKVAETQMHLPRQAYQAKILK